MSETISLRLTIPGVCDWSVEIAAHLFDEPDNDALLEAVLEPALRLLLISARPEGDGYNMRKVLAELDA